MIKEGKQFRIIISWRLLVPVLYPLAIMAAVGFLTMLAMHVCALIGIKTGELLTIIAVFGTCLGLWSIALCCMGIVAHEYRHKDYLAAAFRGCPAWARRVVYGSMWYGAAWFLCVNLFGRFQSSDPHTGISIDMYRALSGIMLPFGSTATAIFYSTIKIAQSDPVQRCPNGHVILPRAKFCEQCGWEVKHEGRLSEE